jgi:hypothetical protein
MVMVVWLAAREWWPRTSSAENLLHSPTLDALGQRSQAIYHTQEAYSGEFQEGLGQQAPVVAGSMKLPLICDVEGKSLALANRGPNGLTMITVSLCGLEFSGREVDLGEVVPKLVVACNVDEDLQALGAEDEAFCGEVLCGELVEGLQEVSMWLTGFMLM